MDFQELLEKRRSVRDFLDTKISKIVIKELLQDTLYAPSASNLQPWEFIVIDNPSLIQALSDESKKNLLLEIANNKETPLKKYQERLQSRDYNVYYNAPALIYIVGNKKDLFIKEDVGICATYLMFAATNRNLATCWIGLGEEIQDPTLRKKLDLNENRDILAAICLGYPKALPEKTRKKEPKIVELVD